MSYPGTHTVEHTPKLYLPRPQLGQQELAHLTKCNFPNWEAHNLPSAPHTGTIRVPNPDPSLDLPEVVLLRLDNMLPKRGMACIDRALHQFLDTNPRSGGQPTREATRSDEATFFHLGSWSKSSGVMHMTSDTTKQSPESLAALQGLMEAIQKWCVPHLSEQLRKEIPSHFQTTDL